MENRMPEGKFQRQLCGKSLPESKFERQLSGKSRPYSTLDHQLSPKLSIHMSAKLPMFRPQRDFQRLSYINIIVNASKGKSNVSNNNNEIIDPSY